jgi:hypothetical protein
MLKFSLKKNKSSMQMINAFLSKATGTVSQNKAAPACGQLPKHGLKAAPLSKHSASKIT